MKDRESKQEMIARLSHQVWVIVVRDRCLAETLFVAPIGFHSDAICAQWIFDYERAEERMKSLKVAFPAVESFTIEHPAKYMEGNK